MKTEILDEVFEVIKDRRENPRDDSYVSSLMDAGKERIYEKIREESLELIEASEEGEKDEIIHEAADVIFHVMVLLGSDGVEFDEVMDELRGRRRSRESE